MDEKQAKLTVYICGFDVRRESADSPWQIATHDKTGAIFADLRCLAAKNLWLSGLVKQFITVAGPDKNTGAAKAPIMKEILARDWQIPEDYIISINSKPFTEGNIEEVAKDIRLRQLNQDDCLILTNAYQIMRITQFIKKERIEPWTVPAEGFCKDYIESLLSKGSENEKPEVNMLNRFGWEYKGAGEIFLRRRGFDPDQFPR